MMNHKPHSLEYLDYVAIHDLDRRIYLDDKDVRNLLYTLKLERQKLSDLRTEFDAFKSLWRDTLEKWTDFSIYLILAASFAFMCFAIPYLFTLGIILATK